MIGKLSGFVDMVREDFVILDVNNVGYKIYCSSKVLDKMQQSGTNRVSLLIETVMKEDSMTLFGFENENDQECFNTLCRVSGIGSRIALKIMSIAGVDEIIAAIINEDKNVFCRASGVGAKVALRIIHELQNCKMVKGFDSIKIMSNIGDDVTNEKVDSKKIIKDAMAALEGLGYQKNAVASIVFDIVAKKPDLTLESVITESLKRVNYPNR
ncbi:MAG: Holliday junction branch migration protein RuvA [Rickettsiales bacterium]|jgi:Holliday junction DNA helicase RuvA|nr:Holliday junction branch migration protein RuvA [Rickettsiales bacterium]